jgi:hypothetical protein
MNQETTKSSKDMPLVARVIAFVFGVLLAAGSVLIFFFVRPLDFKLAMLGMTLATVGTDLLEGAIRARWPVVAMLGLLT